MEEGHRVQPVSIIQNQLDNIHDHNWAEFVISVPPSPIDATADIQHVSLDKLIVPIDEEEVEQLALQKLNHDQLRELRNTGKFSVSCSEFSCNFSYFFFF